MRSDAVSSADGRFHDFFFIVILCLIKVQTANLLKTSSATRNVIFPRTKYVSLINIVLEMGVHLRSNYSNLTAKTNGMENKFKTKKKRIKIPSKLPFTHQKLVLLLVVEKD